MDQMSLLPDEGSLDRSERSTLHSSYNDERVELNVEEIFDTDRYDEFIGITYSISPSFMNHYLSKFDRIKLIVGIPDEHVQDRANRMAKQLQQVIQQDLRNESVAFYEELNPSVKAQIVERRIEMKVPLGYSIHSKFYLLRNSNTDENRIILGSANLSEQAFLRSTTQFENIILYDNHPLYPLYFDYFQELSPVLTDYFPKELLAVHAKKVKNIQSSADEVILLGNEELDRIQVKAIRERLENLDQKVQSGAIPVKILEEIKDFESDRWEKKAEQKEEEQREEISYSIVRESVNLRTATPQLKKAQTLTNAIKKHTEPLKVKMVDESLTREVLFNKADTRNTGQGKSGLLIENRLKKDTYKQFGLRAEPDEIRKGLVNIDRFLDTFQEFTFKYEDEYGQRVMEAILYAFTSPFLFEIKKLSRTSEERNDVPQFLFIGGTAGSGKSSLLKMIAKMMGIYDKPYWNFTDLGSGSRARMERVNTLRAWVSEENVCPILVDELDVEFFSQHNYGKRLILDTTNNKIHTVPPFPTVIGTTNADGYSLPAEARRRSYYLKIDKVFDPMSREASPLAYQEIYDVMDNTLFMDFVLRMAERLEDWGTYNWNYFGESGVKVDFLYQSRAIFKEYYKIAEMPLPRYFPTDRYNDDSESNQEKWRKFYKGMGREHFVFDPASGHLFLQTTIIDEHSTRTYQRPESDVYKEALPQYVVQGSLQGINIELDTEEFFKWLEIDNPYQDYYKDKLIAYYMKHKETLEAEKEAFRFSLKEIAETKEMIQRYEEKIPQKVLKEISEEHLVLDPDAFYMWTKIEPKRGLIDRLFGKR